MEVLVVMAVGVVVGATVFPARLKGANDKLTLLFTFLLIFSMGTTLGARDSLLEELGSLGWASFLFCLLPVIFSVIVVYGLTNLFMSDIVRKPAGAHVAKLQDGMRDKARDVPSGMGDPSSDGLDTSSGIRDASLDGQDTLPKAHDASSKDGGGTTMAVMAVGAVILGVMYGLSDASVLPLDMIAQHFNAILFCLMFFVGVSVGASRGLLGKLRQYHIRVLIIPAGIVIGSIIGGFLGALLTGLPLPVGGAIASGLGWYSLSGVMLTEIAGAQVGSITFLSNLLRELVSFICIPWIAKHLNYPTCIAPAAATSEDTTLPMLIRCTNGETVILAVLNGILCSAVVPVLIEMFHQFV